MIEKRLDIIDLTQISKEQLATRHDASIKITLQSQWNSLNHEEQTGNDLTSRESKNAKKLFKLLGFFIESEIIPKSILALIADIRSETPSKLDRPFESALLILHELNIVNEHGNGNSVYVHPLLTSFGKTKITVHMFNEFKEHLENLIKDLNTSTQDLGKVFLFLVNRLSSDHYKLVKLLIPSILDILTEKQNDIEVLDQSPNQGGNAIITKFIYKFKSNIVEASGITKAITLIQDDKKRKLGLYLLSILSSECPKQASHAIANILDIIFNESLEPHWYDCLIILKQIAYNIPEEESSKVIDRLIEFLDSRYAYEIYESDSEIRYIPTVIIRNESLEVLSRLSHIYGTKVCKALPSTVKIFYENDDDIKLPEHIYCSPFREKALRFLKSISDDCIREFYYENPNEIIMAIDSLKKITLTNSLGANIEAMEELKYFSEKVPEAVKKANAMYTPITKLDIHWAILLPALDALYLLCQKYKGEFKEAIPALEELAQNYDYDGRVKNKANEILGVLSR